MPQRVGLFARQKTPRKLRESFCRVPLHEVSAARKKPQVEARVELPGERRAARGLAPVLFSPLFSALHAAPALLESSSRKIFLQDPVSGEAPC